jgi:hypothetical protein
VRSVALVLLLATGCHSRPANSMVRYGGIVLIVGGAGVLVEPSLNGDSLDKKTGAIGGAILAAGAALLVGSLVALPSVRRDEAVEDERYRKYEANQRAVELLHQAEAAALASDCPSVVKLAPQIDAFDAGVGAVLRGNVSANRCLSAPADPVAPPKADSAP